MKHYWRIDVPGIYGYSFAIKGDISSEADALELAYDSDLFIDGADFDYASAEEITDDAYEMSYWEDEASEV